jgi:L-Lysine epsilon oxidase N-terminal/L-lysine epsilon oxidase C-terminal domain/Iron-containing redox enzyme
VTITRYKIHPAIGIARVGDSPDEHFIGPERPGWHETPEGGRYKDAAGRIKRQASRFRIFGYDENGEVVREVTAAEAEIEWTVELANRKAAAPLFAPRNNGGGAASGRTLRNEAVSGDDRSSLMIRPGPRSISGPNTRDGVEGEARYRIRGSVFGVGDLPAVEVHLGELRTDEDGRLLVLGGHGHSQSPGDRPLEHFADNDGWVDDTSDGPVRARVRLRDTDEVFEADPSWVVVGPPDFAPTIGNVVTLLDVVEQAVADARGLPLPDKVSFEDDILPLLRRALANQWVDAAAFRGHRRGDQDPANADAVERRGDFSDRALLMLLADPDQDPRPGGPAEARHRLFRHIRAPLPPRGEVDEAGWAQAQKQATASYMPPLSGDGGSRREGEPARWLTVTPRQYRRLELWADGAFMAPAPEMREGAGSEPPAAPPTPADLDRAALASCVGGGFYPGIEMSRLIKNPAYYRADSFSPGDRYRLDLGNKNLYPGALTERMAVPWQADFAECENFWWPAQRPDHVVTEQDFERARPDQEDPPGPCLDTLAYPRQRWARGIGDRPRTSSSSQPGAWMKHDMVDRWKDLGFVVPRDASGYPVWVETERARYLGLRDRDYFHIMLNLEDHPGFEPVARELAEWFLADARRKIDTDRDLDSELHRFVYDETTFDTRLDSIYQFLADQVAVFDPASPDAVLRTRQHVLERIRQYGPLNLTDGVWLRNIDKIPPIDGVTDLLTTIWHDEQGGGDKQYEHAHLYRELMRSLGLDPAPVESLEYAQDPKLLDSAFTVPLLQLVVSEFTEDFVPEILGMTLHFEWESVWLMTVVKQFRHHGIDPTFYEMHLAIDNVAEGHGAFATRAVRRYLERFEGEEQQAQWRRIWDGYVAFREAGTLFSDLRALVRPGPDDDPITHKDAIRARMVAMIERKKRYGNLNHGRRPGTTMTNDLFDDPEHLLDVLAADENLVVAGQPDQSGLLKLFRIDGAMYKVFTDAEQQLWRDWILSLRPPAAAPGGPPPSPDGPRHHARLTLASPESAILADPRELRGRGGVQ